MLLIFSSSVHPALLVSECMSVCLWVQGNASKVKLCKDISFRALIKYQVDYRFYTQIQTEDCWHCSRKYFTFPEVYFQSMPLQFQVTSSVKWSICKCKIKLLGQSWSTPGRPRLHQWMGIDKRSSSQCHGLITFQPVQPALCRAYLNTIPNCAMPHAALRGNRGFDDTIYCLIFLIKTPS